MARTVWTPSKDDLALLTALDKALAQVDRAAAKRIEALTAAVDAGIPITQLAKRLGVAPHTIYRDIGRPVR